MGSQVLGRLALSGTADLQIGSDNYKDEYMSRRHVQIDVVKNPQGGVEHHLVEIGSKNIIQLNGKDILRGDEIILNFGDRLTLGKTDIILEETDDEATQMIIKIRQPQSFSEIGRKDNQEDFLWPNPVEVGLDNRVLLMCDGVGGQDGGEIASQTAATALGDYLTTHQPLDGIVTKELFNKKFMESM
ncbi:MAG: FHA domain-containing protein [Bacteroidaceae bacterium]|nr:FHA domain-containing protein [Bacteroidaceae bacterium]